MALPEAQRDMNTLHDMKLGHNSILTVEEKSAEEMAAEQEGSTNASSNVELIDDSTYLRTVIANIQSDNEFQRF